MRINIAIILLIVTQTSSLCDKEYSVELINGAYNGIKYKHGEYFVDNVTKVERGCVCLKEICAKKCCPLGQGYDPVNKICVNVTERFNPPVWKEYQVIPGYDAVEKMHFFYGKMQCSAELDETRIPVGAATEKYHLRSDGKLYVEVPSNVPPVFIYEPDKYCIDTFVSATGEHHLNALICFLTKPEKNNYALSSSCMLISCFFILLTVAVYAWVPELKNLHGMIMMAYLLSFFVGFLFLATMQILILKQLISQDICTYFTFVIYFSLLAAFFWLNVMCYDIWWTFSGKRGQGRARTSHKRFLYFCIYAFGVPTALTILLAALEFSELPIQHPLLPKLRIQGCFLYGNSKLLYLYGPIVILCVANMIYFTLTAINIARIKRDTKMLKSVNSSTNDQSSREKQRFGLYIKLFVVMGINWILEVVSSFYPEADNFWQVSDTYNVLVGLIIFIIFVCKKNTWALIKKRFNNLRGKPLSRTQTTSTSTRTGSQSRDEIHMASMKK